MSESGEPPSYVEAEISIRLVITSEGEAQVWHSVDPDEKAARVSLVTLLGMLDLTRDSIIRDRMGEADTP